MIFFSKIFFLFHKISHQQVADISSMISKKKNFLIFFNEKRSIVDFVSMIDHPIVSLRGPYGESLPGRSIIDRLIEPRFDRSSTTDRSSTRSLRGIATGTIDHHPIVSLRGPYGESLPRRSITDRLIEPRFDQPSITDLVRVYGNPRRNRYQGQKQ